MNRPSAHPGLKTGCAAALLALVLAAGGTATLPDGADAKAAAAATKNTHKKQTAKAATKSDASAKTTAKKTDGSSPPLPKQRPSPSADSIAAVASPAAVAAPSAQADAAPPVDAALASDPFGPPSYGFKSDPDTKAALDAVASDDINTARQLAQHLRDPEARLLIDWLVARAPKSGLSAGAILEVLKSHDGWPEADKLLLRAEQAFHARKPSPAEVLAFYSSAEPVTVVGRLAYAEALAGSDRRDDAVPRIRALWREASLDPLQSAEIIARFGSELTRDDHLYRFRRLVLQRQTGDAMLQSKLLGDGYDGYAKTIIAALGTKVPGKDALKSIVAPFTDDALYLLASARQLRHDNKAEAAAQALLKASRDAGTIGDGDVWWDERRDLSRMLLDKNLPELAYQIAAEHSATSGPEVTEAEFHAGWYALRFLNSPAKAEAHFRAIAERATMSRTKARALYWLGRTYEADGRTMSANTVYAAAAKFGGNFYGQLSREKIGLRTTGVERVPEPTALDRIRFANRPAVHMIRVLAGAGHTERAYPFFKLLADTVDSPGEITLITSLARRIGQPRTGMMVASTADQRGVAVSSLSLPFMGVPAGLKLPDPVDRALIYAVARQESGLNAGATSNVGARGLMQLMPTTAKATARSIDMPFSVQKLDDPLYNATLGAQHLGDLLEQTSHSYVLTFVGYNAGPRRAKEWVQDYGDPRGGKVDPVDWIERIPLDETRNYVQKVMENLEVYRSRLGRPLSLSEDLTRGGPRG